MRGSLVYHRDVAVVPWQGAYRVPHRSIVLAVLLVAAGFVAGRITAGPEVAFASGPDVVAGPLPACPYDCVAPQR